MMQELRENQRSCALYLFIIITVLCSAFQAGCQQTQQWWDHTVYGPPPAYKTAYGPTPSERIAALRDLRTRASSLTSADLNSTVAGLNNVFATEKDPAIRRELVLTLGAINDRGADQTLTQALADANSSVRSAACQVWGDRHDAAAALTLLHERLSTDDDPDVRLAALRAMSCHRQPETIPYVEAALDSADPAVRVAGMDLLRDLSGQTIGDDANAWKQWIAQQPHRLPSGQAVPAASERQLTAQPKNDATIRTVSAAAAITPSHDDGDFQR